MFFGNFTFQSIFKIKVHDHVDLFRTNFSTMHIADKYGFTIQIGVILSLLNHQMQIFIFALYTNGRIADLRARPDSRSALRQMENEAFVFNKEIKQRPSELQRKMSGASRRVLNVQWSNILLISANHYTHYRVNRTPRR